MFLVLSASAISWLAVSSFVKRADLFIVKDVILSEGLAAVKMPELDKLKGQNVFDVDLAGVQARIAARYPQVAGLRVLRFLPDAISISGEYRTPYALVLMDGKSVMISRDGYYIGPAGKEQAGLVLVKGLQHQKPVPGALVADPALSAAIQAVDLILKDERLEHLHLRSVDLADASKMVFAFGLPEDAAKFDVVVDKLKGMDKLKVLSVMVSKTELALAEVKYIDLRFDAPVIGKKKAKK